MKTDLDYSGERGDLLRAAIALQRADNRQAETLAAAAHDGASSDETRQLAEGLRLYIRISDDPREHADDMDSLVAVSASAPDNHLLRLWAARGLTVSGRLHEAHSLLHDSRDDALPAARRLVLAGYLAATGEADQSREILRSLRENGFYTAASLTHEMILSSVAGARSEFRDAYRVRQILLGERSIALVPLAWLSNKFWLAVVALVVAAGLLTSNSALLIASVLGTLSWYGLQRHVLPFKAARRRGTAVAILIVVLSLTLLVAKSV